MSGDAVAGKDPRVASAIAHWAPRFVANGVLLADFQEVTAGISRWEDWCRAWCDRASLHERLGRESLEQGWKLTAGEHLARAAVYYHFAKFVFVIDPDQLRAAHAKAVECKTLALPYLRPPGERVAIPFAGKTLAGVLRKPAGDARPPVVIMISGLDSTKEEMDAYEAPFHARGMATLAFDGPGQGEAEYDLPIRGDFEAPVKAVVDWLETRADVDPARIGCWGVSLGGYYAPRAAAYEPRIKACISISGPYDWAEIWDELPLLTREAFRFRSHKATEAGGARARAEPHAEGGRAAHRLPALPRRREARPADPVAARRADRARGRRAGGAPDGGRRRTQREQPPLPLPQPQRRLDGRAARVAAKVATEGERA